MEDLLLALAVIMVRAAAADRVRRALCGVIEMGSAGRDRRGRRKIGG